MTDRKGSNRRAIALVAMIAIVTLAVLSIRDRSADTSSSVEPEHASANHTSLPHEASPVRAGHPEQATSEGTPDHAALADAGEWDDLPLRALVVDGENGRPVHAASFFVRSLGDWSSLGRSDENGELEIEPSQLPDWPTGEVVVGAEGYVTTYRAVSEIGRTEIARFELAHADSITGRVVYLDGSPGPPGVLVCALNRRKDPDSLDPALLDAGFPSSNHAYTDERGYFTIGQLDPFEQYRLATGGMGLVSCGQDQPVFVIPAERRTDIELTVCRAYGALVVARDANGTHLQTSNRMRNDEWIWASGTPGYWVRVTSDSYALGRFAGAFDFNSNDCVTPWIFADVGNVPVEGPGAFELSIDLPFYRAKTVSVAMEYFDDPAFAPISVTLEPIEDRPFATLRVEIKWPRWALDAKAPVKWRHGGDGSMPYDSKTTTCGALVFSTLNGPSVYRYVHVGEEPFEERLPYDTYRVRFVGAAGWYSLPDCGSPPLEVTIDEDVVTMPLDLTGLSALSVEVVSEEPSEVVYGHLELTPEQQTDPGPVRHCMRIGKVGTLPRTFFAGSVKNLYGIGPGTYRIESTIKDYKTRSVVGSLESSRVSIRAGERMMISLPFVLD